MVMVIAGGTAVIALRGEALPAGAVADRVIVAKGRRQLLLMKEGSVLKRYAVSLGREPEGAKRFEGDRRTPEGSYTIDGRNAGSRYHLALHVSYPNAADVARAAAAGRSAGGDIMIHGLPNGRGWLGPLHRLRDWTTGCIAVTDAEIEELWRAVPDGTPMEIRP
jgi:murein L,D-transpeptidase YafK